MKRFAALLLAFGLGSIALAEDFRQIDQAGEVSALPWYLRRNPVTTGIPSTSAAVFAHPGNEHVSLVGVESGSATVKTWSFAPSGATPALLDSLTLPTTSGVTPSVSQPVPGADRAYVAHPTGAYRLTFGADGSVNSVPLNWPAGTATPTVRNVMEVGAPEQLCVVSANALTPVRVFDIGVPPETTLHRSIATGLQTGTIHRAALASGNDLILLTNLATLVRLDLDSPDEPVPTDDQLTLAGYVGSLPRALVANSTGDRVFVGIGSSILEVSTATGEPMAVERTAENLGGGFSFALHWDAIRNEPLFVGDTGWSLAPYPIKSTSAALYPEPLRPSKPQSPEWRASGYLAATGACFFVCGGTGQPLTLERYDRLENEDGVFLYQELGAAQNIRLGALYAHLAGGAGEVRMHYYPISAAGLPVWSSEWEPFVGPGRYRAVIPATETIVTDGSATVALELRGDLRATFSSARGDLGACLLAFSETIPSNGELPNVLTSAGSVSTLVVGMERYTGSGPDPEAPEGTFSFRYPDWTLFPNPLPLSEGQLILIVRREEGTAFSVEISTAADFSESVTYPLRGFNGGAVTQTSTLSVDLSSLPEGPGSLFARAGDSDTTLTSQLSLFIDRTAPSNPAPVVDVVIDPTADFQPYAHIFWGDLSGADGAGTGIASIRLEVNDGSGWYDRGLFLPTERPEPVAFLTANGFSVRTQLVDRAGNVGEWSPVVVANTEDSRVAFLFRPDDPATSTTLFLNQASGRLRYVVLDGRALAVDVSPFSDFSNSQRTSLNAMGDDIRQSNDTLYDLGSSAEDGPAVLYTRAVEGSGGFIRPQAFPVFLDRQPPTGVAAPSFVTTTDGSGNTVVRASWNLPEDADPAPSSGLRWIVLEYYSRDRFGSASGEFVTIPYPQTSYDLPSQLGNALYGRIRFVDNALNYSMRSAFGYLDGASDPPNYTFTFTAGSGSSIPDVRAIASQMDLTGAGSGFVEFIDISLSPSMDDPLRVAVSPIPYFFTTLFFLPTPYQNGGVNTVYLRPGNYFHLGNVSSLTYLHDNVPPTFSEPVLLERPASPAGRLKFTFPAAVDPTPGTRPGRWEVEVGSTLDASDLLQQSVPVITNGPSITQLDGLAPGTTLFIRYRVLDTLQNASDWVRIGPAQFAPPPTTTIEYLLPAEPVTRDPLIASYSVQDAEDPANRSESEWLLNGVKADVTGLRVDPALTSKGQRWTFRARAGDELGWGPWSSREVTILNSPPTEPFVEIRPRVPTPGQDLIVNVLRYSTDEDGDSIGYDFAWYQSKDGGQTFVRKAELDGSSQVSNLYIDPQDIWEVVYTPFERPSTKGGTAKLLAPVSARDRVYVGENQLPVVSLGRPTMRFGAGGSVTLSGTVAASDPDGDLARVVVSWSDRLSSGLQSLGELPLTATSYSFDRSIPTDRAIYVHLAAYDSKGALRQVYSTSALPIGPSEVWMLN